MCPLLLRIMNYGKAALPTLNLQKVSGQCQGGSCSAYGVVVVGCALIGSPLPQVWRGATMMAFRVSQMQDTSNNKSARHHYQPQPPPGGGRRGYGLKGIAPVDATPQTSRALKSRESTKQHSNQSGNNTSRQPLTARPPPGDKSSGPRPGSKRQLLRNTPQAAATPPCKCKPRR